MSTTPGKVESASLLHGVFHSTDDAQAELIAFAREHDAADRAREERIAYLEEQDALHDADMLDFLKKQQAQAALLAEAERVITQLVTALEEQGYVRYGKEVEWHGTKCAWPRDGCVCRDARAALAAAREARW